MSELGTQVTNLALPLAALFTLRASVFQVSLLRAFEIVPFVLFGLPAGVWIDRLRRRPLMIAADACRALTLASIPLAYAWDALSLPQLYVVAFVTGALAVVFDVSYLSYLPGLVHRERLGEANSKLLATQSGSNVVGPGAAGALVGAVGAPVAIAADAVSFGISAALVSLIRRPEPEREAGPRRRLRDELAEGLRYVFGHPHLRTLTVWTGAWNLFSSGLFAVMIVYLVRGLGLGPTTIGWVFAGVSAGAVAGAAGNGVVVRALGFGRTIAVFGLLSSLSFLCFPLAPRSFPIPVLLVGGIAGTAAGMLFNVNQLTYRQAITPERLLGRMNSVVRFMYWGTIPAGSAVGGALATLIGLRPTLFVEAIAATLVMVPVALSPLRRLERIPDGPPAPAATPAGVTVV